MRFAAIADIHGNRTALEAVLVDIDKLGIDEVVNLGDHFSGPLDARGTADILLRYDFPSIAGDQDRRLLELHETGRSKRIDVKQLTSKHFDWLKYLPTTLVWRDDVYLCHGTPQNDDAMWLEEVNHGHVITKPIEEIEQLAADVQTSLILCAHSHIPRVVRLSDGRNIVNVGSVGCPAYNVGGSAPHKVEMGTPDACYAILERSANGWMISFRFVPYNHAPMATLARAIGAEDWAQALSTGRIDLR